MNSLRVKILIAMVAVTALGSAITAVFASRSTDTLFRQYSSRPIQMRQAPFLHILEEQYAQNKNWGGIQPMLLDLGQAINERVILVENNGIIIGDSDGAMIGRSMMLDYSSPYIGIMDKNQLVGKLYLDPFGARNIQDDEFLGRINHAFLVGSLVVIVIAILFTLLISRMIIHPMEQLTEAVQKLEKGDLSVRVNNNSNDESGKLARAFNKMAESLSLLEQLRRNMVSDVAHELRTPLTNVRGYLEAAQDGLLKTDQSLVNNLYEETMLINRLVDDLQDLALAEAGHLRLDRQPLDIALLLQNALELSRPRAQNLKLQLNLKVEPDLPTVQADNQRIMQVVRNLLNNAMDHTPADGTITVSACAEGAIVHITVADTGMGMPADQLNQIFERFYRADPSRARSTGGNGLGLSIVKQLVELHGGQVWAESSPGSGATFHFTLLPA